MGMIALVRSDFLKQRHTSYWGIHTVIPHSWGYPVCVLLSALSECR